MNPRLPTEYKKLKGTLNVTKEKNNPSADVALAQTSVILPSDAKITVPRSITERSVKRFFKDLIKNLQTMRVLSRVDLQQIETMCITLQKLKEVQNKFVTLDVDDKSFDEVEKKFERLSNKFDALAKLFYINPAARTQLKLNDLNLIKTAQEVQQNQSAIGSLLNERL